MSDFVKYLKSKLGLIGLVFIFTIYEALICYLFSIPFIVTLTICMGTLYILLCVIVVKYFDYSKKLEKIRTTTSEAIVDFEYKTNNPLEQELFNRLKEVILERNNMLNESETKFIDSTEYFTMWMHQIKTPISGISLIAQNIDNEDISNDLKNEVTDINDYVDMVLNYLRLGSESKDLLFTDVDIDKVIKGQLKKFSNHFFAKNISIDYKPSGKLIKTDEKWISFVIGQLLSNALKYSSSGTIYVGVENNIFRIKDQGIGIAKEDLPRVFEKGYTGYNGRIDKKSTGIGLYLVKKVCDMISVGIDIKSELGKGTEVLLKFQLEELDVRD